MKKYILFFIFYQAFVIDTNAQQAYDSISISRFTAEEHNIHYANWKDSLKTGTYQQYLAEEKTIWKQASQASKTLPDILLLTKQIKTNGTEDVSKCFIPRHAVNYYKGGKLVRFLLVCFECDGVRFSDDPATSFIKNINTRDKQMAYLKKIFSNYFTVVR